MKRLWKWFLSLFPYDKAYVFYRQAMRAEGTARIAIELHQDVYRQRRWFRTHYWYGTILVRVVLSGVRFYTRDKSGTTSPLRGAQEYTLRCDNDYVELLKHLTALEIRGYLTPIERLRALAWQDMIMTMWPPSGECSIHAFEETEEVET